MLLILTRILAITCLAGMAVPAAVAEGRPIPTLLEFIGLWLNEKYQLEVPESSPSIIAVSSSDLVYRRFGADAQVESEDVVALYDAAAGAILVSKDWDGRSPADLSVLVHEMVHHLQAEAGTVFACPAAREKVAYHAQNEWLKMFGEDLESAFGIEPNLILVATACVH